MDKILLKQALFYGSYLAFPCLAWLAWRLRRPGRRWFTACVLAAGLVFVWARFVEPQMIRVRETTLPGTGAEADIALISDIHLGIYKDSRFLHRLVERINDLPVDAVVIAGDLTYEPQARPQCSREPAPRQAQQCALEVLFAPLSRVRVPVLAVLGNHDQQAPGPDIDQALRAALGHHGVKIIEGKLLTTAAGYRWAGLGDRWAGKDDPAFLAAAPSSLPTFVVAHNPDSAMDLDPASTRLLLAGHTHGGQIRSPGLYRRVIPSAHGFDRGEQFASTPRGRIRVFTTSGVGEIGLPMRLFNPPTIDVLHLRP